jgi:hypothetical protein
MSKRSAANAFNGGRSLVVGSDQENKQSMAKSTTRIDQNKIAAVNGLLYVMPSNAACAVSRQFKTHQFDRSSFSDNDSGVANCFINSGADYADGNNSYLRMTVAYKFLSTTNTAGLTELQRFQGGVVDTTPKFEITLGSRYSRGLSVGAWNGQMDFKDSYSGTQLKRWKNRGSAMNHIKNVRLRSRSGVEIDRLQEANLYSYKTLPYRAGRAYTETQMTAMGVGKIILSASDLNSAIAIAGTDASEVVRTITYCIPLKELGGFFEGPGTTKLIPAQILSGLKVEIDFEKTMNTVFAIPSISNNPEVVTSFTGTCTSVISDLEIVLDSVTLTDGVLRKLNEQSAKNSLEYYFTAIDTQSSSINTSTQLDFESRKAASRVIGVCACDRLTTSIGTPAVLTDFFSSTPWTVKQSQSRIGGQFYPNTQIVKHIEHYVQSLWAVDKYADCRSDSLDVRLEDFMHDDGVYALTFERSNVMPLSGVPLNNSRTLSSSIKYQLPITITSTQFLSYVKLLKIFINNAVIRQ